MTPELRQLLIDCANFIQPYDDGDGEATRLMTRLDEALEDKYDCDDCSNFPCSLQEWSSDKNKKLRLGECGDKNKDIEEVEAKCYCGEPVDTTNPDCVEFNLCKEHQMDA